MEKLKRECGYYWVRIHESRWDIGKYNALGWEIPGWKFPFEEWLIDVIDENRLVRK
jgi:hypothetical protein